MAKNSKIDFGLARQAYYKLVRQLMDDVAIELTPLTLLEAIMADLQTLLDHTHTGLDDEVDGPAQESEWLERAMCALDLVHEEWLPYADLGKPMKPMSENQ
jgi:hypothetical protein